MQSNKYLGYSFYVCGTGSCCPSGALAYMVSDSTSARFGSTKCAWILRTGKLGNNYDITKAV